MAIETTHARDDDVDYGMKVPATPPDTTAGKKIVTALRKWAKRHDAAV